MREKIKKNVFFYISGNLASKYMEIILKNLRKHKGYKIGVFTDNYLPEISSNLKKKAKIIKSFKQKELINLIKGYNIVITSIRSPGNEERSLIKLAKKINIPSVVFLADLGSGVQKFIENNRLILPNKIAVPDKVTYNLLIKNKIPKRILVKFGSPYLDQVFSKKYRIKHNGLRRIGFFSIPNSLDFDTWQIKKLYDEYDVLDKLIRVSKRLKLDLSIRLHPKEYNEPQKYLRFLNRNVKLEKVAKSDDILKFINKNSIFVSTYSTSILLTKMLGKPSLSFQPTNKKPIRQELYSYYKMPLATTEENLYKKIRNLLSTKFDKKEISFLYNKNKSLKKLKFLEHIL